MIFKKQVKNHFEYELFAYLDFLCNTLKKQPLGKVYCLCAILLTAHDPLGVVC